VVNQTLEKFKKIDILVNNAGIVINKPSLLLKEEEFDLVVNTNLKSVFFLSQAVARHMMKKKYGRIVNISSASSLLTVSNTNMYPPSKAGVVHLTRQLASEWARYNITVNAVSPWFIKTEMSKGALDKPEYLQKIINKSPAGRIGNLEDIVSPVLFLCSDGASYVNGLNLVVDGGASHFGV